MWQKNFSEIRVCPHGKMWINTRILLNTKVHVWDFCKICHLTHSFSSVYLFFLIILIDMVVKTLRFFDKHVTVEGADFFLWLHEILGMKVFGDFWTLFSQHIFFPDPHIKALRFGKFAGKLLSSWLVCQAYRELKVEQFALFFKFYNLIHMECHVYFHLAKNTSFGIDCLLIEAFTTKPGVSAFRSNMRPSTRPMRSHCINKST